MVKRVSFFLLLFLGIALAGCSNPTFCSTPYILSGGDCCLDTNKDTICDNTQKIPDEDQQPSALVPVSRDPTAIISPRSSSQQTTSEGVLLTVTTDDDPFLGNETSAISFVVFGDYVDATTQRFHQELLPVLLERYGNRMKYVFRNYPEINNDNALLAAEASECADAQGKFWDYHDALFHYSHRLTLSLLRRIATDQGLDVDAFETCLFSHRFKDEVLQDRQDGTAAGAIRVPTFFINNRKLLGLKSLETFDAVFQDLLSSEIQQERGKILTAHSTGVAYALLEGPAALDPSLSNSPYSNRLELIDAQFTVTATDITPEDSGTSRDTATLTATYTSKSPALQGKDTYTLALTSLLSEGVSHSFYGGVGIHVPVHGNSGIGTRYLPRSDAYLTLWGLANVSKNDELLAEDALVHFMITKGIRDEKNQLLSEQDEQDIEAYLLVSGPSKDKPLRGITQGFLYLFWPDLNLREL